MGGHAPLWICGICRFVGGLPVVWNRTHVKEQSEHPLGRSIAFAHPFYALEEGLGRFFSEVFSYYRRVVFSASARLGHSPSAASSGTRSVCSDNGSQGILSESLFQETGAEGFVKT